MIKTILRARADIALLLTRFIIGGIFLYTGWLKVSDMATTVSFFSAMHIPAFLAYLVSYGELVGGALLILGWGTVWASLFLMIIMIVAVYLTRSAGMAVSGLPLSMLGGLIAILGGGAGKYRIK